jgi:hypothetical protein
MPRRKNNTRSLLKQVAVLGALVITKKLLDKTGSHEPELKHDDRHLERKLAITAVIYHAIGIFYNE